MTSPTAYEIKIAGQTLCEICGRPKNVIDLHLTGSGWCIIRCIDELDCWEHRPGGMIPT